MKTTTIIMILLGFWLNACAPTGGQAAPTGGAPSRLDQLKTTLYGADDVARLTSIAQLEADGSPEAVTLLGNFLLDATGSGRLDAASALLRINTDQSLGYIRMAMTDKELTSRRQAAMQALESNGDASYPFLKVLMRDSDETVRLNSLQVIQFIGSTQARTLLMLAIGDPSPAVQQAAVEALRALGYVPSPTP
jgi:HEAT repeat protein